MHVDDDVDVVHVVDDVVDDAVDVVFGNANFRRLSDRPLFFLRSFRSGFGRRRRGRRGGGGRGGVVGSVAATADGRVVSGRRRWGRGQILA